MRTATKSMTSYVPKRGRAKRTRSWMVVSTPKWGSARATTVTSPNHAGTDGADWGENWMSAGEDVILVKCPPLVEKTFFFPLRRHMFSLFGYSFPFLSFILLARSHLVAHPVESQLHNRGMQLVSLNFNCASGLMVRIVNRNRSTLSFASALRR
jgi:hypothetical protein